MGYHWGMSGPIMRENFATQQLIYVHPDPVPSGAQLEVGGGETLILTFNDKAQDPMGPGIHSIFSPSYRVVHAYFVLNMEAPISFEGKCVARCPSSKRDEEVGFRASARIQASNAKRLVEQLATVPVDTFAKGMAQRISDKLAELVKEQVSAAAGRTGSIAEVVVDPAARLLIAQVTSKVTTEGIGFPGLDVVEFGDVMLWSDTAQLPDDEEAGEPAEAAPAETPAAGAPPVMGSNANQLYPNGTRVFAAWEGQWYPAIVVGFANDQYNVDWEGNASTAWVSAEMVRPA